jgi:general bacterial porin, GBP family
MKKTLVAIAALASVSAFAQSTVVLDGNLDIAYEHFAGDNTKYKGSTVTTLNNASTSTINLTATEDLGAGNKATARVEIDPRAWVNDGSVATAPASTSNSNNVQNGGLNRHQVYVGLAGNMGDIKLGAVDSLGLKAFLATSPLGTGIGSGYAPGGAGTAATTFISTRWGRSAQYTTPTYAGFTAAVNYATGNDDTVASASRAAANGVNQNRSTTEIGLNYANGPLAVAYVNLSSGEFANGAATATAAANTAKQTTNILGAQYALASTGTTLYVGMIKGGISAASGAVTTDVAKAKATRFAVKQAVNANIDVSASYQTAKLDVNPNNGKDVVKGIRADYKLSKTAMVYAGLENWTTGASEAALTTRKTTAIGIRKAF